MLGKHVYRAAPHFHDTDKPDVVALNVPVQFTGLIPPGNVAGTGQARPVRKISSGFPEAGTVVTQVLLAESNEVLVQETLELKVISALGTVTVYVVPLAVKVIVEQVKLIVVPAGTALVGLKLALNQMKSPLGSWPPLKFDPIVDAWHGDGIGHGGGGGGQDGELEERVMG